MIIVALGILLLLRSRRKSKKVNKYNQRRYNKSFRAAPVNNRYRKKDSISLEEKEDIQDIIDNESSNDEFEGKSAKSTND